MLKPIKKALFTLFPELPYHLVLHRWLIPDNLPDDELWARPKQLFGHAGIDLQEPAQLERLRGWGAYERYFRHLRHDPAINTRYLGRPYLHNDWYPTPDAEVYAAMILDRKPTHIIEVGAGFSTRIAKRMIDEAKLPCTLTIIDPEPRADVEGFANKVLYKRIEDVAPEDLPIDGRTIFFVDSSHVTKPGGDVPILFARILPELPSGTLVHVHDIYTPYDYPTAYKKRLYTEQYMLQAMLAASARFRVVFATHFMSRAHTKEMRAIFGSKVGLPMFSGASFWFEVN